MSTRDEAKNLAERINATYGKGRIVAHPDVIVDPKFTSPDAVRLREIQQSLILAAKPASCLGGSG